MKTRMLKPALLMAMLVALCGCMGITSISAEPGVSTGDGIAVNTANFPDKNFYSVVKAKDTNSDGILSPEEIAAVTEITYNRSSSTTTTENNKRIKDLKGIEYFTELQVLSLRYNDLVTIDLSQNTKLVNLDLGYNDLTAIDLSALTELQKLVLNSNKLTALDLSRNTKLTFLNINSNRIPTLNLANNTALTYCNVGNNVLTSLDLSANVEIANLLVHGNALTALDVSMLSKMVEYEIGGNDFSNVVLSIEKNPMLIDISVGGNPITDFSFLNQFTGQLQALAVSSLGLTTLDALNLAAFTELRTLYCNINALTSIDITKLPPKLESLYCQNNQITALDVSGMTGLRYLTCFGNGMTSLKVAGCTALYDVNCRNNALTTLDFSGCTALYRLYCDNNALTSLNLAGCKNLYGLYCYNNQMTALDVSGLTRLRYLDCYSNGMISLNVAGCTALYDIDCKNNALTSLDFTGCTALYNVYCSKNQLTSINLGPSTRLYRVECYNNALTELNISGKTNLNYLYCYNNALTELNASGLTRLRYVRCYNNALTSLNVSGCTGLYELNCRDNNLTSLDVSTCTALKTWVATNNTRQIALTNGTFDLATLPGFDVTKASGWTGGATVNGTILTLPAGAISTSYTYDCGRSKTLSVTLDASDPLSTIAIDATNFPDAIFRNYVSSQIDKDKDGLLSQAEQLAVTYISVQKSFGTSHDAKISSLKGIEYFPNLQTLYFGYNNVSTVDLSRNTKLHTLDCSNNPMAEIDLRNNPDLIFVLCYPCYYPVMMSESRTIDLASIPNFDVSRTYDWVGGTLNGTVLTVDPGVTAVKYTYQASETRGHFFSLIPIAPANVNVAINATNFPDENFRVRVVTSKFDMNQDGVLSFEEISAALYLNYQGSSTQNKNHKLQSVKGIEFLPLLRYVYLQSNQLNEFDISKNPVMTYLNLNGNQVTALDVTQNTELQILSVARNGLSSLKLSQDTRWLSTLDVSSNNLTSLDVRPFAYLESLLVSGNSWTSLQFDIESNPRIETLYLGGISRDLFNIDMITPYKAQLKQLQVSSLGLTALDLTGYEALTYLDCANNALTALDVSMLPKLTRLYCEGNRLTALDLSANTLLEYLYCDGNQLTALNVSGNPNLKTIRFGNNLLAALDLSKNTQITSYNAGNMQPRSIAVTNGTFNLATLENFDVTRASGWTNGATVNGTILTLPAGVTTTSYTYDCGNGMTMTVTLNVFDASLDNIAIDAANFPDANFRKYVAEHFDTDKSGVLSYDEVMAAEKIDLDPSNTADADKVASLKGIEFFRNLTYLDAGHQNVAEVDLSKNLQLYYVRFYANKLTKLDVTMLPLLERLYVGANQLTELDLSKNPLLEYLKVYENKLTVLDISIHKNLVQLYCYDNPLTELDISNNLLLTELECQECKLTTLKTGNNTKLKSLLCYRNQIASLDVSQMTALTQLNVGANKLTTLNVTNNTKLTNLYAYDNLFTALDLSKLASLKYLTCGDNQLTALDISNNPLLQSVSCFQNKLTAIDTSKNPELTVLDCGGNQLLALDVSNNTKLTRLICYSNQLTSIDLTNNTAITTLDLGNNTRTVTLTGNTFDLATLPGFDVTRASGWTGGTVSGNILTVNASATAVTYTYKCSDTHSVIFTLTFAKTDMIAINAINFPDDVFRSYIAANFDKDGDGMLSPAEVQAIVAITLGSTTPASTTRMLRSAGKVASLDGIGFFTNLKVLVVESQNIAALDLSENKQLETVVCTNSQIETLVVGKQENLTTLDCSGNQIKKLEVEESPKLETLACSNNAITEINVAANPELKALNVAGNAITEINVTANPVLQTLNVAENAIAEINVAGNAELKELNVSGNEIKNLDVSENKALTNLDVSKNEIVNLDVKANTNLTELNVNNNQIKELDVSENKALTKLEAKENKIEKLDVSTNPALENLNVSGNSLTSLNTGTNNKVEVEAAANKRIVVLDPGTTQFDLVQKLHDFDVNKASSWSVAPVGSILTVPASGTPVTYNYEVSGRLFKFEIVFQYGVKVNGNIKIATPAQSMVSEARLTLTKVGSTDSPISVVASGDHYDFGNIASGKYTLEVSMKNFVSRTYEVEIGEKTINQVVELNLIGDITGDGKVNSIDMFRLRNHINRTVAIESSNYSFNCADTNGDGRLNTLDLFRMRNHINGTNLLWP